MTHRKAVRITVGTSDVDVPLGVFAANQVAQYDGTQFKGVNGAVGPGSSTNGDLAMFSGITGGVLADSGVAAASVMLGAASAVSGNIVAFNGTSGKVTQDSGVSATAHAARHAPGGADSIYSGAFTTGDVPAYNGLALAPKFYAVAEKPTDQDITAITQTNISSLAFALPRAGSYWVEFELQTATLTAAASQLFSASFSGSATRGVLNVTGMLTATTVAYGSSTFPSPAAVTIARTLITTPLTVTLRGSVTVTGAGTLQLTGATGAAADALRVKAGSSGLCVQQ